MQRQLRWVSLVILLVMLAGCAAPQRMAESVGGAAMPAAAPAVPAQPQEVKGEAGFDSADADRMIIRTADLSLVVTDAEAALKAVLAIAANTGGYVANSQAWRQNGQLRARISVRIPAESLDSALEDIKALAVRVEREERGGRDVTEEYSDLGAQLRNLEATENELRELLSEVRQRTQKAEDILEVYRELTKIREEIERVKGRMQYLSNLTALATVTVELIPDVLARPVVEPGWRPLETLRNASRALINALQGLVEALIWLVVFLLPVLLAMAIPIVLLVLALRWLIRRSKARRQR